MIINVTKPFIPSIDTYQTYLRGIWKREWLTNHGPLVNELELKLKEYLNIEHMLYVSNGTIALQIAIKALELKGEIITTPFSYVATTAAIVWENCTPVMVDILPDSFNIDPSKIEEKITDKTSAILATHVFGNPCDVEAIEIIAKKHNLKIIYDAAHCFATKYKGKSIYQWGDISTASFHATKLFHTVEGGAIFTNSSDLLKKCALLRNFGHTSPISFNGIGINAKNSEFHAAMGLSVLPSISDILSKRCEQYLHYLEKLDNIAVNFQKILPNSDYNYAYFPVVFENEAICLKVIAELNLNNINPRRYFYPSLSQLNYVENQSSPISEDISKRILCLPLFHDLSFEEIDMICRLVKRSLRYEA